MRYYSNNAVETTLALGVTAGETTITVSDATGFPATTPFTLALDAGAASEELVDVTGIGASNQYTVTRAFDGTTATAHSAGAVVKHVHSAADFRESRQHEEASAGVHGVTGDVLGTSDTQVVSNKTFDATNTFPSTLATDIEVGNAVTAHANDTSVHGVAGDVVGTTDTQTLTNKTLTAPVLNNPVINQSAGWTAFTPTMSNWDIGDGAISGRYTKVGRLVRFRIRVTLGSTSTMVGNPRFTLPVAADTTDVFAAWVGGVSVADVSTTARAMFHLIMDSTGVVTPRGATGGGLDSLGWTWASGDVVELAGTYESAA